MEVGNGSKSRNGRRRSQKRTPKPEPKQKRQRRASVGMSFERSVELLSRQGKETLERVNQKRRKLLNSKPNSSSTVFDNTCPEYRWLGLGWIVEERIMLAGRLYRYYYDAVGQKYSTRQQVESIFQDIERNPTVIIIDD